MSARFCALGLMEGAILVFSRCRPAAWAAKTENKGQKKGTHHAFIAFNKKARS
jgi:hypothetical protein